MTEKNVSICIYNEMIVQISVKHILPFIIKETVNVLLDYSLKEELSIRGGRVSALATKPMVDP